MVVLGSALIFFHYLDRLLLIGEQPQSAEFAICLGGGGGDRVRATVELYRRQLVRRIIVTTEREYQAFLASAIPPAVLLRTQRNPTSTYEEALFIKQLPVDFSREKVLIISDPYHLFRARWTFYHLFPPPVYSFGFIASRQPIHGAWWGDERTRMFLLCEFPKILYYWLGHGLCHIQEDPPWAQQVEQLYIRVLFKLNLFFSG